jgi:hypothetical protein
VREHALDRAMGLARVGRSKANRSGFLSVEEPNRTASARPRSCLRSALDQVLGA